jgi:hypothetical protein
LPHIKQGFDARKTLKRAFAKVMAVNTFKRWNNAKIDTALAVNLGVNAGDQYRQLKSPMEMSENGSSESLIGSESTLTSPAPVISTDIFTGISSTEFEVVP